VDRSPDESLEQAFQKAEVARIEAQNKALDELLKKAHEAIVAMQKVLPEKEKLGETRPGRERPWAKRRSTRSSPRSRPRPKARPTPPLEKALKDAQEKLAPLTMAETSALAAVSATKSNIVDAEAEVKRITDAKDKERPGPSPLPTPRSTTAKTLAGQEPPLNSPPCQGHPDQTLHPNPSTVALSPDGQKRRRRL
jgi:hypothetical protein